MRTQKQQVGDLAEETALSYLQNQGLTLMTRNFSCPVGEIDLIMQHGDEQLIFVEVRSKRATRYGLAQESVGFLKQKKIIKTAQWYLQKKNWSHRYACRFDVIAFNQPLPCDVQNITWIKSAFQLSAA